MAFNVAKQVPFLPRGGSSQ